MFKKRVSRHTVTWIFVSLLTLTTFALHEIPPVSGVDLFGRIQRFFTGSRPQGVARGRQRGGSRRDRCPNVSDPLIAIVPFDQKGNSFVEKTVSERPSFWFYVPYLPTARRQAEFVIIDENEEDVYTATFPLSQQPGLVSLKLPPAAPSLRDGKQYQWIFSVICNPLNRAGDATVNGSLEKVPINDSLKRKLQTASSQDAFALYAEEGLWYEAMAAFAGLGKTTTQDTDLQTSWKLLQQQLGLPESSIQKWVVYILPDKSSN